MHINMPGCYIQEKGALRQLGRYFKALMSEGVLVVMDEFSAKQFKDRVVASLKDEEISYVIEKFEGECCKEKISELVECARICGTTCVVGIGGGKVLDVAKAVGHFGGFKTIMVPTVASTDGPCSKLAVLYEADGTFKEYLSLGANPQGVLVDVEIIAKAPVRFLKAGIGDALSTYFETEAGREGKKEKGEINKISETARALSKRCFELVMSNGYEAVQAVEKQEVNEALEKVVEAILYLSCIGFENGSLAAAHAVANGLSGDTQYNSFLHGEKVAFGTIVQMLLEEQEETHIKTVRDFCAQIGLPYTLGHLSIEETEIELLVERIFREDQPIHNMCQHFKDKVKVREAILATAKLEK